MLDSSPARASTLPHQQRSPAAVGSRDIPFGLAVLAVAALASVTRLTNLLAFQVHTDEATWILWTDAMDPRNVESVWATFRADGRTPLYSWAVWAARQTQIEPLLAARLVSAVAGIMTTWAVLQLGARLFDRWIGLAGAFLYAGSSYAIFFERIANDDALATLIGTLGTLCAVAAAQRSSFSLAALSGVLAFLSFLAKPTGALFLGAPIVASVLLARHWRASATAPVAVIAALACYTMLAHAAGPLLELMDRNRAVHALPLHEILNLPLDRWTSNWQRLTTSWHGYHGSLVFLAAFLGGVLPMLTWRSRVFVITMALLPLGFFSVFGGVLFSRYLLLGTPFLCLLAGAGAVTLARITAPLIPSRRAAVLAAIPVLVLALAPGAPLIRDVIAAPEQAALPPPDRDYVEGVASGWGVHEMAEVIRAEAVHGRVVLLKRSGPFYPEIAVLHVLRDVPNVRVRDERLLRFDHPSLAPIARWRHRGEPIFFLVNACCWEPGEAERQDWRSQRVFAEIEGVRQVAVFDRPGQRSRIILFRL